MIKEKELKIIVKERNIKHYINNGFDVKINDIIKIKPENLSNGSVVRITSICSDCGKERVITYYKYNKNLFKYGRFLCHNCSKKQSYLNKYGVDNPMKVKEIQEKVKKTNLKKYGFECSLLSDDVKNKIKKTNLERYGVEFPLENKKVIDRRKNTNMERYGVEHYSKTIDFYKKTYKRWEKDALEKLEKYNIKNFILKNDRTIDIRCDNGHYFNITAKNLYQRNRNKLIYCTICNPLIGIKQSGQEINILNFIKDNYNGDIEENNQSLIKKELDIYIPNLKLAFEFNGIYWHSDLYKDRNYHLEKTELCEEKGIQLIHIYEDEWFNKEKIVKSMILNKLGKTRNKIYGRKCEIHGIDDNKLIREFLEKNHIQGFIGSSVKIGLFYDEELVSLMTFGKRRVSIGKKSTEEGEYELLRFCSKLNTNVIGGAQKLFKYFIENYSPKIITTYADRSWSVGDLYKKLGFQYKGKTQPNYYYFDRTLNRNSRFNFRKDKLVREGYDKNKTECEIMDELKYLRVYNSGNLKFEMKN